MYKDLEVHVDCEPYYLQQTGSYDLNDIFYHCIGHL